MTFAESFKMYHALVFTFGQTNNEAEYEAIIGGIRLAKQVGAERVRIRSDSRLIVGQIPGTFEAREDRMMRYKDLALELLSSFTAFEITQLPREENLDVDMLSKL